MRNFKKEILQSGITLITEKKSHFNSISIGLWVKTGSSHESAGFNGISHFIEHLLFKGTKNRTYRDINIEIDFMGGALNAFTGTELTCLYTKALYKNYDSAIDLLIDMMFNSVFPADEIEKEKGVILQEISGVQDDPSDYSMELFHKDFYGDSAYAYPILGTADTIKNFNREKILSYYRSHYNPQNMVISAAGNLEHDEIADSINRHMSKTVYDTSDKTVQKTIESSKVYGNFFHDRDLEQTHFLIGLDGICKTDEDFFTLEVLNTILGGSVSSKLFQEVRENKGLAYAIYSNVVFHKFDGYLYIYAGVSPNKFELSRKLIFSILDDIVENNIKEEDIRNAKKHIYDGFLLSIESTGHIMNRNAINEIYEGGYVSEAHVLKKIDEVDETAVKRVSRRLFENKEGRNLTVLGKIK